MPADRGPPDGVVLGRQVPASRPGTWSSAVGTVLAGLAGTEVFLWAVLAAENRSELADLVAEHEVEAALVGLSFAVVGAVVLRRYFCHALGWLFALEGQLLAMSALGAQWAIRQPPPPLADAAAWVAAYAWVPAMAIGAGLLSPLFPDGRPPAKRGRALVWVAAGAAVVCTVAVLLTDALMSDVDPGRHNPLAVGPGAEPVLLAVAGSALAVALGCGILGALMLALRMRRTTGAERRQIAWFFTAFIVAALASVLPVPAWVQLLAAAFLPVALGVAILRYGLYEGDRMLNRGLVYGCLTLLVAGTFGIAVGVASNGLGGGGTGAVVAAVVIALGLSPVSKLVQRGVDRLLYGQLRDPYAAIAGLGRRLSRSILPDEVLPTVVGTVSEALHLPWVAVFLGSDPLPAAAVGIPGTTEVTLPLRYAGEELGRLTVGLRPGQRHLDPADEVLLRDFADQIGPAAHLVRLKQDLEQSRNRLLIAREQERHRIRRDLHDGLGPTLAGLTLGLGAARRSVVGTAPAAEKLLGHLQEEMQTCLEDVRRLLAEMRPTMLEQVGLVEALRQQADALTARSDRQLVLTVSAPTGLPTLPPDVEVAAYRIAMEATTNIARHARAQRAELQLDADAAALRLVIRDDGIGLPAESVRAGLGLRSMLQRARQVGGRCEIGTAGAGGTLVTATLPLQRST